MKRATREWVKKAEADYRLAERTLAGNEPFHDQVCFLYQQSAEKYLKALLEELGRGIPKTHDLALLFDLVIIDFPTLRGRKRGLNSLTEFAVVTRYPGENATKRQALAAKRCAGRVRDECRSLLRIRTRRRKAP